MTHTYIQVPRGLRPVVALNEYSDTGARAKAAFHRDGMSFLRKVAKALDIPSTDYRLSSNKSGIAGSGEVTLHSDDIYIQLSESCLFSGVQVLYRSCKSRKDYAGNRNNFVQCELLADEHRQTTFIEGARDLMQDERDRKAQTLSGASAPAPFEVVA